MRARIPVQFEAYFAPLDLWTDVTAHPVSTGGIAVFFRDVTKRRRAEEALRDSEQRLRFVLENMAEGLVIFDASGNITDQNPASVRIHDRRLSGEHRAFDQLVVNWKVRKYPDGALVPPEQWGIPRVIRGERILRERFFVDCIEDPERSFVGIYSGCAVHDQQGKLSYGFLTMEDITEQARAEASLREANLALRISNQRLGQFFHSEMMGSICWEIGGLIMEANDKFLRMVGYTRAELLAGQVSWSGLTPPEYRSLDDAALTQLNTEGVGKPYEKEFIRKDGSRVPVLIGSARRDGQSECTAFVLDITDSKRAEADARRLSDIEAENRQMQEASRLKSQFLANMSHELRTPLNAVIGFADLMYSGFVKPDSPKQHEFLGHIGTSGRHLLQLINDVLDLSKIESGKFEFFPEHVDVPTMLQEVQDVLHTAISRKSLRISSEIDPYLIDLNIDPGRLKQVLYNYLSNAIKFTAAGGRVTVRALAEGPEHFRIEVEDTGIGISASDLPQLFSEFQQIDAGYSKQHQGTGLGLALTRRLVQAQGGHVGVRSTVGVGSVFHVVLNRTHGRDTQRAESHSLGVSEREAERLLVIEDDFRDQALLVEALSQAGFEVDRAADGPYALRRARDTAHAAPTPDLRRPDKRELEPLGDIGGSGASHASPVPSVTLRADLDLSATFAIANVLCKPIRSDEILSAMTRFKLPGKGRANVMVIDDEQRSLDLMRATLMSIGIDAVCFQDGRTALEEIDLHRPDAIVLDLMMPAFDGFQVLDALQRLPAWREVPVFIWTSMLLTDNEYATLARSARAILIKGGGSMEAVLDGVRRWRHPVVADTGEQR